MTEQELEELLSKTAATAMTVDASVNPPHGQITKVTYTRAQVAALIAKVAPRMTEPTMSAEQRERIDELLVAAIDQCEREQPLTPLCDGCALHLANAVYLLGFADGQARGRAEMAVVSSDGERNSEVTKQGDRATGATSDRQSEPPSLVTGSGHSEDLSSAPTDAPFRSPSVGIVYQRGFADGQTRGRAEEREACAKQSEAIGGLGYDIAVVLRARDRT